jgi:hypothetical protein
MASSASTGKVVNLMSLIHSEPQELHILAEHFGFSFHRLSAIVERRQISPVEIKNGVALFDPAQIRALIRLLPNNLSRS